MFALASVVCLVLLALGTGMSKHQDQLDHSSHVANVERKNFELRGLADFLRSWPRLRPQQPEPQYSSNMDPALAATQYVEQPQMQNPSNMNSVLAYTNSPLVAQHT